MFSNSTFGAGGTGSLTSIMQASGLKQQITLNNTKRLKHMPTNVNIERPMVSIITPTKKDWDLQNLSAEHRKIFEKAINKNQDMRDSIARLKIQQSSYEKYKQAIKRENDLFNHKIRAKEDKIRLKYSKTRGINSRQ